MEETEKGTGEKFRPGDVVVTLEGRIGVLKGIDGTVARIVSVIGGATLDDNGRIVIDDSCESFDAYSDGLSSPTSRELAICEHLMHEFSDLASAHIEKTKKTSFDLLVAWMGFGKEMTALSPELTDVEYLAKIKDASAPLAKALGLSAESPFDSLRAAVADFVSGLSSVDLLSILRFMPASNGLSIGLLCDIVNGSTQDAEAALLKLRALDTKAPQFVTVEQHLELANIVGMMGKTQAEATDLLSKILDRIASLSR